MNNAICEQKGEEDEVIVPTALVFHLPNHFEQAPGVLTSSWMSTVAWCLPGEAWTLTLVVLAGWIRPTPLAGNQHLAWESIGKLTVRYEFDM